MFVELPPELCCIKVLGFSSQVVNTVSLIPSFMHRIEYFLLATQLQKELEAAYSEAAKVSPKTVQWLPSSLSIRTVLLPHRSE